MAENNIPPALPLSTLIASYPKLNDVNPSSWFIWSDNLNLQPKSTHNTVCHAMMRYVTAGYDHLVTAVPRSDDTSLRYLRMLIHGPFKAFSDLTSLVRVKDAYYLQCDDLKKWPANVLFNFCIASRVPIEFEEQLTGWRELVKEGYPEVLAFLLSHSGGGAKPKGNRPYPEHGHHWFDPSADWRKIIDGTPDLTGTNYHHHPLACTPSNKIWGTSNSYTIVRSLDNVKAAKYYGFELPPKRKQPERFSAYFEDKPIGLAVAQINHILQNHQGALQAAGNAQLPNPHIWANPFPAAPVVEANPIHDAFEDNDHDFQEWLNEDADDL